MKPIFIRSFLLHTVLVLTILQGCAVMARIEEPAFESIKKDGDFEVRQYRGFIVAETFVKGDMDAAGSEAFRAIAGYIFGGNISATASSSANSGEKIAMTAPVTMEKTTSEKIAMTAPVTMEKSADEMYRVHFVMPSQYTMQTLPKPVNPKVTLREVAAQKMAVIRFSGFSTDEKVRVKTEELTSWIEKQGLKIIGKPQFARYDPPMMPPFLRRSEVMIAVE
jgi:effector-binding domain-containing protein